MPPKVFVSLESTSDANFRSDTVKYVLIGLLRDLRGIAMATKRLVMFNF
jgi:exportin-7